MSAAQNVPKKTSENDPRARYTTNNPTSLGREGAPDPGGTTSGSPETVKEPSTVLGESSRLLLDPNPKSEQPVATLKLWSCCVASLCSLRQELKMSSSVSRSQTFSSLIRASSCSSRELVSGERDERGFSSREGFGLAGWVLWEPDPECSDRIFWGGTTEEDSGEWMGAEAGPNRTQLLRRHLLSRLSSAAN